MFEASVANIPDAILLNDSHSKLNPSWVRGIARPTTREELQSLVQHARSAGLSISVGGARHAMGGQQFGSGTLHCDTTVLDAVLSFDPHRGLVEVQAGITWPSLVSELRRRQPSTAAWTIAQKQTGADRLSLGGAIAANIHGRGLTMRPFIDNIESLTVVNPNGEMVKCSRTENAPLFSLVVGGYGLFGIVYSVTLRLVRRTKMRRVVEITDIESAMEKFHDRIRDGFTFGDFQYMTDEKSPGFLRTGVMACYHPVPDDTAIHDGQQELSSEQWRNLIHLSHVDKAKAYEAYAAHYRATSGQVYFSDDMQMSTYLDDYHEQLDKRLGSPVRGSEMITEIYVPRGDLARFMRCCAEDFRKHNVNVIYGTVRLIERDEESFLAWAREPWACIIFNLHVDHTPAGIVHAGDSFRRLIDRALDRGGSYYLTYHRFATAEQLIAAHLRVREFMRRKRALDPTEVFSSDWYMHYARA